MKGKSHEPLAFSREPEAYVGIDFARDDVARMVLSNGRRSVVVEQRAGEDSDEMLRRGLAELEQVSAMEGQR